MSGPPPPPPPPGPPPPPAMAPPQMSKSEQHGRSALLTDISKGTRLKSAKHLMNDRSGVQVGAGGNEGGFDLDASLNTTPVSFSATPVPMPVAIQPSNQSPLMPGGTMLPGSVAGFPPTGQKYATPPVPGQMLLPNQASRSGDSTPQRITPQPHGAYPSTLSLFYGQPVQDPNELSSSLLPSGNVPGNGFNRTSSAPTNIFRTDGPPSASQGISPSACPGAQQSPYMARKLPSMDGHPPGFGSRMTSMGTSAQEKPRKRPPPPNFLLGRKTQLLWPPPLRLPVAGHANRAVHGMSSVKIGASHSASDSPSEQSPGTDSLNFDEDGYPLLECQDNPLFIDDPNFNNKENIATLHRKMTRAIKKHDLYEFKYLINNGFNVDSFQDGKPFIETVASAQFQGGLRYLLLEMKPCRVNPMAADDALRMCSKAGNSSIVGIFIKAALQGTLSFISSAECFKHALISGCLLLAKNIIYLPSFDVNEQVPLTSYSWAYSLHLAIELGCLDMAIELIRHGAKVDATNWTGITPLMQACGKLNVDAVRILISNGANPNHPIQPEVNNWPLNVEGPQVPVYPTYKTNRRSFRNTVKADKIVNLLIEAGLQPSTESWFQKTVVVTNMSKLSADRLRLIRSPQVPTLVELAIVQGRHDIQRRMEETGSSTMLNEFLETLPLLEGIKNQLKTVNE